MTAFLDTNFIVRYLTDDPPDAAAQATSVIDSEARLTLTDTILAECAYVLESNYQYPRELIVEGLISLLAKDNIDVFCNDKWLVSRALEFCRPSKRVSFADALLWSAARHSRDGVVYTFDQRFPSEDVAIRRE